MLLHYIINHYPHLDVPQVLQIKHPSWIYESFISAIGTFFCPSALSTICYIFFQCSFYTIFPCVNVFTVKLQRIYQFDNTINRHSPTKYTRNQFSIVPIFFVELFRQTFNGCFVSTFVSNWKSYRLLPSSSMF